MARILDPRASEKQTGEPFRALKQMQAGGSWQAGDDVPCLASWYQLINVQINLADVESRHPG
jgi:hypothetical protein